jgi:RNA polymerase sigma-70 factor, ECF subfamily
MLLIHHIDMQCFGLEAFQQKESDTHQFVHANGGRTFAEAMHTDSKALWQSIKNGDHSALKVVFDELYSSLCRFAMQWVNDADEAEEIVQKLFVDLWTKRADIEIEITLKSYLYSATRNRSLNYLKHRKVVHMHQRNVVAQQNVSYEWSDTSELNRAISRAMDLLPEQCGRVFRLVKVEGKRYAEVSEELGISNKTIENHMTKALRILREELKEFLPRVIIVIVWLSNKWMN